MRPLRFCMLTTFYPPFHFGGDAVGVQRLSRALVRRGHEVTVIHDVDAWKSLTNRPEPAIEPEPEGLSVIRLRSRLGILSTLLTQQLGRPVLHGAQIERILAEGRFDVIQYHNVSLVGGPGLLAIGDAVKLYLAHEHWLVCPTHVLWRYKREPCPARECLRCQLAYHRPPQFWRSRGLLERNLAHVDLFLAASEFSRKKHAEFGFPREMEVLPYFLPDERLPEKRLPGKRLPDQTLRGERFPDQGLPREGLPSPATARPHERPYFLFVGRLERIKGLDDVIPSFATFRGADLLVVGDGTHAGELRRIAAGAPGVRFLGRVSDELLARCYAHALAVIVPSAGFETFGITVIEAFRAGLPVVVRAIGPLPEMVEASGGGLVFRTTAEFETSIRRLASEPTLRESLGRRGREAFRAWWSEDVVLPRYLDLVRLAALKKGAKAVLDALA